MKTFTVTTFKAKALKVIDQIVKKYFNGNYDYATNTLPPTFPDGLDVEILSFYTLKKIINKKKK